MKCVVLAAGKGVRMMPLTRYKPKVLIEVAGRPFLYHVLENIRKAGFKEAGIVVHYFKDKMKAFLDSYNGLKITLIEQEEVSGTGTAVVSAKKYVGKENFVLVMGDNLYSPEDIGALSEKEDAFCYAAPYVSGHPQDYGVITFKGDRMIKVDEKPKKPASNLVNTGLYKFTSEVFPILEKLKKSPRGEYELTDAMNVLAKEDKMRIHVLKEYWIDMSSIDKLPQVEEDVLSVI